MDHFAGCRYILATSHVSSLWLTPQSSISFITMHCSFLAKKKFSFVHKMTFYQHGSPFMVILFARIASKQKSAFDRSLFSGKSIFTLFVPFRKEHFFSISLTPTHPNAIHASGKNPFYLHKCCLVAVISHATLYPSHRRSFLSFPIVYSVHTERVM